MGRGKRHGISIGIERVGDEFYLFIKLNGKLTHTDYNEIIPFIESSLSAVKKPKLKVLVDMSDFEGWESRAAWDDFRFALRHGSEFDKIALYKSSVIDTFVAKVSAWFLSGEVKNFDDYDKAYEWLNN